MLELEYVFVTRLRWLYASIFNHCVIFSLLRSMCACLCVFAANCQCTYSAAWKQVLTAVCSMLAPAIEYTCSVVNAPAIEYTCSVVNTLVHNTYQATTALKLGCLMCQWKAKPVQHENHHDGGGATLCPAGFSPLAAIQTTSAVSPAQSASLAASASGLSGLPLCFNPSPHSQKARVCPSVKLTWQANRASGRSRIKFPRGGHAPKPAALPPPSSLPCPPPLQALQASATPSRGWEKRSKGRKGQGEPWVWVTAPLQRKGNADPAPPAQPSAPPALDQACIH